MKTLKSIKTKRMMTMVANAVEKSINEEFGHYSEIKIKRKEYKFACVFEIIQDGNFFMLADYMKNAFNAIDPYTSTYEGVWMVIETEPFYVEEQNTFLHRPVIEVHINIER